MSMSGVTTFRNIFHSQKVEQNCTSTLQYHFLRVNFCTPTLEITQSAQNAPINNDMIIGQN